MVFVFSGQGSQHPGMVADILREDAGSRRVYESASEIAGMDVLDLCTSGDPASLSRTDLCQISVAATSLAWMGLLREHGCHPMAVAGHSLGEYCAACAAGCMTVEETLRLIWVRGRAMLRCAENVSGFMLALIGAGIEEVSAMLHGIDDSEFVYLANHNSSKQVVLAGEDRYLKTAIDVAVGLGARAIPLDVGGAFHTPAMSEAKEPVAEYLENIPPRDPSVTLFSGLTGKEVCDAAQVARSLTGGITATVRWHDIQSSLYKLGADPQVEVGPGRTLNNMARRDYADLNTCHVSDIVAG
ncbi:MAG: ACP S-malonyltransferase [Actinomycetota bacterium]|nr:ACP S-malonyltransferase [Actinomycetota bacterium]